MIKHLCALGRKVWYSATNAMSSWGSAENRGAVHGPGSREILVTVDSGAAASVCPAHTFEDYDHEAPDPGVTFLSANGQLVPEMAKVVPVVVTEEQQVRATQFSVADVHKPLMSAAQVANRGHRIVLEAEDKVSYIEELATGERMRLYQVDGVYVQKLVVLGADSVGFGRQAIPEAMEC